MTYSSVNKVVTLVSSAIAGGVFAIGLILAQMVDPNKVVAFLRVFNRWDPSLALVMGAAIAIAMPAFWVAKRKRRHHKPAFNGDSIDLPTSQAITPQLCIGGVLFGIGWGLVGFCPAPALVSAFAGYMDAVIFLLAMLGGFLLHALTVR